MAKPMTLIHPTNKIGKDDLSEHDQQILDLIGEGVSLGSLGRAFPDTPKSRICKWLDSLIEKGFITLENVGSFI